MFESDAAGPGHSDADDCSIYGTSCRVFAVLATNAANGDARAGKPVEKQMNATLRRGTREAVNRDKPSKTGITIFGAGLGEGFEAAFAVAVMLGALWLLLSGYV